MEITLFCIIMGMLLAIAFVGIGVCVERIYSRKLCHDNSSSNVCSDDSNNNSSDVGDIHGKVNSGQDVGYIPSTEQIMLVLNTIPATAQLTNYETECVEWAAKIIEKVVELVGNLDE